MRHPSVFLLLIVGAILAVQLASSTQQHQNNRLKPQKPHHAKSEHHDAVQHQSRGKKATKLHHEPVRAHGGKPRIHTAPVHHEPVKSVHHEAIKAAHHTPSKAHHLPGKHHVEGGGKRHLEIQKPPKPFLQPPLMPKHQRTAKHHGKQERNNKHR